MAKWNLTRGRDSDNKNPEWVTHAIKERDEEAHIKLLNVFQREHGKF